MRSVDKHKVWAFREKRREAISCHWKKRKKKKRSKCTENERIIRKKAKRNESKNERILYMPK